MLARTKAKKLTIYVNAGDRHDGRRLYVALVELARRNGIAGATVTRAMFGYGQTGAIHSDMSVETQLNMPLKVEIVDSPEAIDRILPDVTAMVDGLVEIMDVDLLGIWPRGTPYRETPK